MKHALLLDTMVYLHYRPVDQIDWHAVLALPADNEVVLVVPGITLREIDKHKNHTPRLRDRARRVSDQLTRWLSDAEFEPRPGLRVHGALARPGVQFAELGLDPASNDDVLVAAALDFQRANADVSVTLVTQDSYPEVRARSLGLATRRLPDDLRLPTEEDATEKENKELRRRVQQLQAATPVLDIQFAGGAGKTLRQELRLVSPLSNAELAAELRRVGRRWPSAEAYGGERADDEVSPTPAESDGDEVDQALRSVRESREQIEQAVFGPFDGREVERYAKERTGFLRQYADYLREHREYERLRGRRFGLRVELINTGSAPASDIDVYLHIPDGVLVTDEDDLVEPREPKPPRPPRRTMDIIRDGLRSPLSSVEILRGPDLSYLSHLDRAVRAEGPRNVSALHIEATESFEVRCHVVRVKHGLPVEIPVLYVTVPEDTRAQPFQVAYALHAANVPVAVSGVLNVVPEESQ